ncbi:MAG: cyclomaltodextrinase C-terminal domain-containing protein, partial [Muribaculaceae bacterium]|nr:cyclomaltodextrinase C-terminal domain-containing protein [Muribaculaceae bacterium]
GNVRRDMPGGFPGDEVSVLDFSGMTDQQREAFDYLSKLLHWRKGNDIIAKGKLKHFIPTKGQYIYERRLGDRAIQVIMNGTDKPQNLIAERITEILPTGTVRRDVITGKNVNISPELVLEPRAVLILEDVK